MMLLRSWRCHLLLLVLVILQVLALESEAPREDHDSNTASLLLEDEGPRIGANPASQVEQSDPVVHNGQPAVDAALNILRNLNVAAPKNERPSGFLGHAQYYAKQLFYILFMNAPSPESRTTDLSQTNKLNPQLREAVQLLEGAADDNNPDALFLLAEMNFYGNYTNPRNYSKAFNYYQSLASLTGNSTAQYMLGFMYATGIGGAVERDQGKAMLYHTFAAMNGNIRSQMTLAFRRYMGIGASQDCDQAAYYYKQVADKAIEYYRSGPPGGRTLTKESYRWADDQGGVYGEGASVSSSGPNANRDGHHANSDSSLEDVLEYLVLRTKDGDVKATFTLGKMYYEGTRHLPRNFKKAMIYFGLVAKQYWNKDGKVNPNHPVGIEKLASKAAGHIGLMFLRGEGTEQNFEKAAMWFKRGIANGDASCQHYLGLMYLHGYGVPQDALKAAFYFKASSEQDFPAAEVRLGALFLDQGDVSTATRYFELAARYRSIEAYYYLAEIADQGLGGERHCGVATAYYKMVAEKAEALHSAFNEANTAYENGDKETALIAAMMAAEQGYENAQANVAFLLDEQRSVLSLDPILPWSSKRRRPSILKNAALALIYWTRSARQANADSLVKMGDYYLQGYGTSVDIQKASSCYHTAAEGHHSAQAFWNLGWMYENGIAVEQDFHMAKRYYDLALETNEEAYLPTKLSLLRLKLRSFWSRLVHGKANSIQEEQDSTPPRTFKEWITAFISYDEDEDYSHHHRLHGDQDDFLDDSRGHDTAEGHDGYYDELDLDVDDGILESLIIIGLAMALVLLVQWRQRALRRAAQQNANNQNNNNNANQNQQGGHADDGAGGQRQEEDRGLFPRPDDPDFAAWVAGGVGH
ncbi:hypothetical protein VTO42DRAFT_3936 [Malbranchea cinnamomea]